MWAREDARDKGGCGAGVDQEGALEEGEEPIGSPEAQYKQWP